MSYSRTVLVLGAVLAGGSSGAVARTSLERADGARLAQTSAESPVVPGASVPELSLNDAWRVRVTPRVWFAGPAGDLRLPGGPSFELSSLEADSPKVTPMMEVTVREVPEGGVKVGVPTLIFAASGAITSAESSVTLPNGGQFGTLSVAAGSRVDASVDWSVFQLAGGQVWRLADLTPAGGAPGTTVIDLAGLVGARVQYQRFEFASGGVSDSDKQTWVEGILQTRLDVRFNSSLSAEVNASVAWAPDRFGGDIDSAFTFTPWRGDRGQALAVQVGYRLLAVDYEVERRGSKTEFNGSLAGLYAGVSLKF